MKLTFIANACNLLEYQGTKLLTDPWLIDGAFYGSWFHYPKLNSKPEDFSSVDGIYISHAHPDHYQPESLKRIGSDKPLLILKREKNILKEILIRDGFKNIIEFEPGRTTKWKDLELTFFDAFVGNPFTETSFGNPLDSALLIKAGAITIFNANDNTPDLKSCHELRQRFGEFTVAQLNYNAAGPYPSCFQNLEPWDKEAEHKRVLGRNLKHLVEMARVLKPMFTQPFAGSYVLGGKEYRKNETLGTVSSAKAASFLRDHGVNTLCLGEGGTLDYDPKEESYAFTPEPKDDVVEQSNYITKQLSRFSYDFEDDLIPTDFWLDKLLSQAFKRVRDKQVKLKLWPSVKCFIGEFGYDFSQDVKPAQTVRCELDPRLLMRILMREAHWNNAEIGCHIDFKREPNDYSYDFHMLMSFLHV